MVALNPVEARVVGCLMEKEITTPEYYPLSLNAMVNACNQKSSRDPVMELTEPDVRGSLFSLEELGLVRTLADSRVSKFEHRTRDQWNLRRDEFAIICQLLLRGPQTSAELRARSERFYTFDDASAAQSTLERLAARTEGTGPLVVLLPRQPGSREARWMHLLSGPVAAESFAPAYATAPAQAAPDPALTERIEALEERVRVLEERLQALLG